jgi:two-component system phosphate regulon response regulator OmpR
VSQSSDSAGQGAATILIVEDDERMAGLMRDVLTMEGYRIDMARTAEQAWQRLGTGDFGVILCDMALAGLGAPRLHRRLRGQRPDLVARLVFVSGVGPAVEAFQEIAADVPVLQAPFQVEEFLQVVEGVLHAA